MFKLFTNLNKYKFTIITIVLLIFTQAIMELFLPTIMSNIIDEGIMNNDMNVIFNKVINMVIVVIVSVCCALSSVFLASKVAVKFGQDIRRKVFEKVQSFSMNEFNKFGVASLITRTTNDITQVQTLTQLALRMMIFGPLMAVGGIILAFSKDYKLSMILMISIPILIFTVLFIAKKTIKLFSSIQYKLDKANLIFRENLTGIRVVRAFNRQNHEEQRFDKANKELTDSTVKAYKIFARLIPSMMFIFYMNSVLVVWFGGLRVGVGSLLVGDMIAFIQYSLQIMISLMMLSMLFGVVPKALSSARRIMEVLDTELTIKDTKNTHKVPNYDKTSIKFENVYFSYTGSMTDFALEDVSFDIKSGETVAIIGGTGSSKSTILNLIPRFYDVSKGKISINDIDIKDLSQKDLRNYIGYIPQKAVLFSGSIRSNICYGKENVSEEEITKALKISQAYDFVNNLDKGLDFHVAQGGSNLSGGQKQRLSIARAIVRGARIYLFDDSFSALDFKTDAILRAEIKENIKDAIILIVGQRISSVMNSDKIIVLDNGKIIGVGKHSELMKNCDVYQEIAKSQLSEEELS